MQRDRLRDRAAQAQVLDDETAVLRPRQLGCELKQPPARVGFELAWRLRRRRRRLARLRWRRRRRSGVSGGLGHGGLLLKKGDEMNSRARVRKAEAAQYPSSRSTISRGMPRRTFASAS